ncbi:TnsA-like heteromeric transposase endonuclease subunit [Arthrobacter sp. CAU 1506]|uniref:TnsA-like heteromeric transposase endonuclease subunit n=1 Tax=Arthrobacter sp. CAU 1506 TaxID=2560052 RepID=UPI0010ABFCE4|nr:TnsA-like heteromeric transposase endonuclease subunit [Arthrobacter sp. CAU 1506]TJY66140.1 TnsA-like heteromeric transposase endonuclease subunit [Arthrobacter sp. CAU 1506]
MRSPATPRGNEDAGGLSTVDSVAGLAISTKLRLVLGDRVSRQIPFADIPVEAILKAGPVRNFSSHRRQKNLSGRYWCSTVMAHVVYESLFELVRLQLADFDPSVWHICAQPFEISGRVGGRPVRHVPDFFLARTDRSYVVVNVTRAKQLDDPRVQERLQWAGLMFLLRGWQHEVWSGAPLVKTENIRFLAGFRRDYLFEGGPLTNDEVRRLHGMTIGEAALALDPYRPGSLCRPLLFNALWKGTLTADLDRPLGSDTGVEAVK